MDTPGKRDKSKDHPEGLPVRPGTPPLACPFREIQVAGYAHLHTTLNKSRDEKLKMGGPGRPNGSGERAGVMVWRMAGQRDLASGRDRQKGASTWARTRDLSVNSRALCQLSHGGVWDAVPPANMVHRPSRPRRPAGKMEVLPGFEPGSLDSKSRVLTITP